VFSTYSTLATVGGLLNTGEAVEVKKTKQTWTFKNSKQKFFNILGKHWMIISIVSFISALIFAPKILFYDKLNDEIDVNNYSENLNTDSIKNEPENPNNNSLLISKVKPERSESSAIYSGRFDQIDKRPLRVSHSSR
jgi:hypothetical protein